MKTYETIILIWLLSERFVAHFYFGEEEEEEEEEAYSRVSYFSTEHIFLFRRLFRNHVSFTLYSSSLLFSLGYSLSFFVSINAILLKPVNVERCHHHSPQ